MMVSCRAQGFLLASAAAVLVSSVFTRIPSLTAIDLLRGTACFLAFYASLQFFRGRSEVILFLRMATLFGGLLSGLGLAQLVRGMDNSWWHRPDLLSSTYVNHNHFAGFLEMVFPAGVGLTLYERDVAKKITYFFATALMLTAFIFSLSRGGVISLTAGLFVFFWALRRRRIAITIFPFVVFGVALAVSLAAFGTQAIEHRIQETRELDSGGDLSLYYRFLIWRGAWTMILQSPWLGGGPGTFGYLYLLFRPEGSDFRPVHAHNDFLEVAFDTGVPALALLLCFLGTVLMRAWKKLAAEESRLRATATAAAVSGLVAILVHSFVDFNWQMPANAVFVSVLAGLAASQGGMHKIRLDTVFLARILAVCVLAVCAVWGIMAARSDALANQSEEALEHGDSATAFKSASDGLRWNPWNPDGYYRLALAAAELAKFENSEKKHALEQTALKGFEAAQRLNPHEPYYGLRRAETMLQASLDPANVDESVRVLREAVSKDPGNGRVHFMAGRVLAPAADADWRWRQSMEDFFHESIRLHPAFAEAIYEILSRKAHYSLGHLDRFYRQNPADGGGWLRYLERHQLWMFHRKYMIQTLERRPEAPDPEEALPWKEVSESRAPFRKYLASDMAVDMKIFPSYEMVGLVPFPGTASRLKITAKGSMVRGAYPYLLVRLDGKLIDSIYVDSEKFQAYTVPLAADPGPHTVTLRYANDYTDLKTGRYRDLWIRDIILEVPASPEGGERHA